MGKGIRCSDSDWLEPIAAAQWYTNNRGYETVPVTRGSLPRAPRV